MAWTREQLIARTLTRIDESGGQAAVLDSTTVGRELDDAARVVLSTAPPSHLFLISTYLTTPAYAKLVAGSLYSVLILLPATFVRLLTVKLESWHRAVENLIEINTPEYERQAYDYDRARPGNPVAAIVPAQYQGNVWRAIECFPAPTSLEKYAATSITAVGIPLPRGTSQMVVNDTTQLTGNQPPLVEECVIVNSCPAEAIPDSLVDAMIWLAAERCLTSLRVQEGARNCQVHFKEALAALETLHG